ncbi:hypothetical protein [Pseudonocardia phyllosphaerae]|uniref:hypothetical protein n=1 Tax=Pseudonocardia phyllosphaerae TaxID=3390502 RepID=UPI00397DF153
MKRLAGAVVGMSAVALVVAYLAFGWPVLLVGGPLFVGVAITVAVIVVTERPRAVLVERREERAGASPWRTAAERGEQPSTGLMSGFFELSSVSGVAGVPEQRPAPAAPTARPAAAR